MTGQSISSASHQTKPQTDLVKCLGLGSLTLVIFGLVILLSYLCTLLNVKVTIVEKVGT